MGNYRIPTAILLACAKTIRYEVKFIQLYYSTYFSRIVVNYTNTARNRVIILMQNYLEKVKCVFK